MRKACLIALVVPLLAAGKWTEYKSGPFHILSASGDRAAREALTELEQLRHVLGGMLGKADLQTVWPVHVILSPGKQPATFVAGGSATLVAASSDTALPPELLRGVVKILLEDNVGRMPAATEAAIADLFSTIQVNAGKVAIGSRPNDLPADRAAAWAKLEMLATNPDYSGKLRVYLNNLQQAMDEPSALKNAFSLTPAALADQLKSYAAAATPVSGRTVNPNKDYIEVAASDANVNQMLDELRSNGKNIPPDSARGLAAKNTRAALELAVAANPKWAEPHIKLADLESTATAKVPHLKQAATLAPRDAALWQRLAETQMAAAQYADAAKSWAAAEKAAPDEGARARIHIARLGNEEQRADFSDAERKRIAEERARALEQLKADAAAEIHAAEQAANERAGGLKSTQAVVAWWGDENGTKVEGTLTRVDCLTGNVLRFTVQSTSGTARYLVRDPSKLMVRGATASLNFACGAQQPPRKILLFHDGKADSQQQTSGDVGTVELPQ